MNNDRRIKLLTGNSHPELAKGVADKLGIQLCACDVGKFSNQEISVNIHESVREADVFVLQTGSGDVNDSIMELLILVSACQTASARRITAVIPSYPYARQDKKDKSRAPITAKLIANMLVGAGCGHVITMDLHASQIQGFFDIPCDNVYSETLMVKYIKQHIPDWRSAVIVSPDAGGAKRATNVADRLTLDFALVQRKRNKDSSPQNSRMELLLGNVRGKTTILIDDMIDSGETIRLATISLVENGATSIYVLACHGLLSAGTIDTVLSLPIKKLVVTDTVPQNYAREQLGDKLDVIEVSGVIAEAIRRQHNGESISILFEPGMEE